MSSSMNEFEYLNLSKDLGHTKYNIKNINNKNTTYIFAKNGVGKTLYSREIKKLSADKNILIFNKDYVENNVLTTKKNDNQELDNTQNTANKKNVFEILIAENIRTITDKLEKKEISLKDMESKYENEIGFDWCFSFAGEIDEPPKLKIKDLIDNSTILKKIDSQLLKKEITDKINDIKKLELFNEFIKESNFLLNRIDDINNKITDVNGVINEIKSNVDPYIIELHRFASEYTKEEIEFVNKVFKIEEIKDHYKMILDKKTDPVKKFNSAIDNFKNDSEKFLNNEMFKNFKDREEYKDLFKLLEIVKKTQKINTDISKEISPFNNLDKFSPKSKLQIEKEIASFFDTNKYSLLKEFDVKKIESISKLKNEIKDLRKDKKEAQQDITQSTVDLINDFLSHFGFNEIKINLKPGEQKGTSGTMQISIEGTDKDIKTLSSGETNIIAFSFFLANLNAKLNNSNEEIAVLIDDPFDSNDHSRIHQIKTLKFILDEESVLGINQLLFKYSKLRGVNYKLIFTTHNIQLIYSLTSNLEVTEGYGEKSFSGFEYSDSIEIREWSRESGNEFEVIDEFIDSRSIFPNENVINRKFNNFLGLLHKKILNKEKIDFNFVRLMFYVLIRINDQIDEGLRNNYKQLVSTDKWIIPIGKESKYRVMNKQENLNTLKTIFNDSGLLFDEEKCDSLAEQLEILNKQNDDLMVPDNISDYLIEMEFEEDVIEIIKRYIMKVCKMINYSLNHNDPISIARYRHKNYRFANVIAYALDEF